MGSNSSAQAREVHIPSVFIGADDGLMIVKHFTYGKGYVSRLNDFVGEFSVLEMCTFFSILLFCEK